MSNTSFAKSNEFNVLDFVMEYEGGLLSDDEIVKGFQHLIDSGLVWKLQGSYGRMAASLIKSVLCIKK